MTETTTIFIAMLIMVLYVLILGIGIGDYVMQSLSIFTIAKRRGIKNPWLSWIPMANIWMIGNVADDYDMHRDNVDRKWRSVLLCLTIITVGLVIFTYIFIFAKLIFGALIYAYYMPSHSELLELFVPMYLMIILISLVSVALSVCQYICYYKIFESAVPKKSVKYLIISILVPLGLSICLMKCRNQDYLYSGPIGECEDFTAEQE